MQPEHYLMALCLGLIFVNFFVKSRLVLPAAGMMICVAGIIEITDTGSQWFQWAFIIIFVGFLFILLYRLYDWIVEGRDSP